MYRFGFFSGLCAILLLLGCHTSVVAANVELQVFSASGPYWLAVSPSNDNSATTSIDLMDGFSASFAPMMPNPGWGYYTFTSTSGSGFVMPVTLRLSDAAGNQISVQLSSINPGATVDTGASFGTSTTPTTPAPAPPATEAPAPPAPSTQAPAPPAPSTQAPAPPAPSTQAPAPATSAPSSTNLCGVTPTSSEPLKLLVPLYVYPGSSWTELITAASQVQIIAIINPNSGPLPQPDSNYASYMSQFKNAGIQMIGYVHTSYGARAISDVEADISTYAATWPGITGIFIDEASPSSSEISYYTQVYQFATSKGFNQVVLNPGTQPDQGYLDISTSIVAFENDGAEFSGNSFSSWVGCAPSAAAKAGYKYHFAGIAYNIPQASAQSMISSFSSAGFGLVYTTDTTDVCCIYNTLVDYFAQEASVVQSLN